MIISLINCKRIPACDSSLLLISIFKVIYVILRVELSEYAVYVLGSLPAKVRDVETYELRRHVVVGRDDHLNVFFLIMLTQVEDLLRGEQLVVSQEIKWVERCHLIHGPDHIHGD